MFPKYDETLTLLKHDAEKAKVEFEEEIRLIQAGTTAWQNPRPKSDEFRRALSRYTAFLLQGELQPKE